MIRLRSLLRADAPEIARLANNRKIWIQVRDHFPYPYTLRNAEEFLQKVVASTENIIFGIEYQDVLAGMCGLHPFKDVNRKTAEIGYWVGEEYWGLGIASQAVLQMVNYARENTDLRRLQASVFSYNDASMRVLEKCGFKREGILKEHVYKDGNFVDEHVFGLLLHNI